MCAIFATIPDLEGGRGKTPTEIEIFAPCRNACTVTHTLIAQTNVTRQEMHRPTECLLFIQAKREERAAEQRVKDDPLIIKKNVSLIKDYPILQIANVDLAA